MFLSALLESLFKFSLQVAWLPCMLLFDVTSIYLLLLWSFCFFEKFPLNKSERFVPQKYATESEVRITTGLGDYTALTIYWPQLKRVKCILKTKSGAPNLKFGFGSITFAVTMIFSIQPSHRFLSLSLFLKNWISNPKSVSRYCFSIFIFKHTHQTLSVKKPSNQCASFAS